MKTINHAILQVDDEAIHDFNLVVDRLAMLSMYEEVPHDVVVQDLISALLLYWVNADFQELEELIEDLKAALPGFRDHETFDAISKLSTPGASRYDELQGCLNSHIKAFADIRCKEEPIIYNAYIDNTFKSIHFSVY